MDKIFMPKQGEKYKHEVKYVKHFAIKSGMATSFSITSKRTLDNKSYFQTYSFVVWDNLDIMDGDYINILTIDSVEEVNKNGKSYINLSGKVSIIKSENAQYAEEQAPAFVPTEQKPEEHIDITDDEFKLPFDI